MAKNKSLNNLLHFYLESGCSNMKVFAEKYDLSYNTLTEQIRNDVEPTEESILHWCKQCHLPRVFFDKERPTLSLKDLHYWNHPDVRFTLPEIYNAFSMVAEEPHFDHDAFERVLHDNHYSSLKHGRNPR